MGTSAEIDSFQIVTDRGETFGPFTLSDISEVFYFEFTFVERCLHFEALSSGGGNTGAIGIEVYGFVQD